MLPSFTKADTNMPVNVDPSTVRYVKACRDLTQIFFHNDTFVTVTEPAWIVTIDLTNEMKALNRAAG
jgi:hypothetical protein